MSDPDGPPNVSRPSGGWRRTAARVGVGLGLLLTVLCQVGRVEISPASISTSAADPMTKAGALQLWNDALTLSNAFLASDFRHTLPPGRIELDDANGMTFVSGDARLSVRVWSSMLGRLAVWSGAVAQECDGGFRVGPRGRNQGGAAPSIDHSWFRQRDGDFRSAHLVARTLLHELAHIVHRTGNFGVLRSLVNYGEIGVTFRSATERSFERAPVAVSHEFTHWWLAGPRHELTEQALTASGSTRALEEHMADPKWSCEHGAAEIWQLAW